MRTADEITAIYERHADTVWRVCFAFMKNHDEAQDLLQETFVRLIRSETAFDSPEHEKAWLIVTASNLCKNALKSPARRTEDIDDHEELPAPETAADYDVAEAILKLPPEYKDVIYLYYYAGYRSAEIAKLQDKPPATVRTQLARARKLLKKFLEEP